MAGEDNELLLRGPDTRHEPQTIKHNRKKKRCGGDNDEESGCFLQPSCLRNLSKGALDISLKNDYLHSMALFGISATRLLFTPLIIRLERGEADHHSSMGSFHGRFYLFAYVARLFAEVQEPPTFCTALATLFLVSLGDVSFISDIRPCGWSGR